MALVKTIRVVGNTNDFDFEEIKESVVKIHDKYYFKHDAERVVRIIDGERARYFRVNSPLLVKRADGKLALKSACIQTEDGVWLDKTSPDVIEMDGKYYRASYTVVINDTRYLITDPRIVKTYTGKGYLLKENSEELSKEFYGGSGGRSSCFADKKDVVKITDDKGIEYTILKGDATVYWSGPLNKPVYTHRHFLKNVDRMLNILSDFQDKTNPQEDRLVFHAALHEDRSYFVEFLLTPAQQYFVHKDSVAYFEEAKEKYIMPRYESKIEALRDKCNKNYSDLDKYENTAKSFKHISKPFPGKHNIVRGRGYGTLIKSATYDLTGGLKYTFGVELETSDGLIESQERADSLKMLVVGDRSIGSGEYVTSPLAGDAGINNLEEICGLLNKHTLVDDRCGLHVHVGGAKFTRDFLINSIRLGALIEEELYTALPKSRTPTLYHCHSIKRYADIEKETYDTFMGAYIFGPKEYWLSPTSNCPYPMFKFSEYKLNERRNANSPVGQWQDGRYKWLNLINAFAAQAPHKTIEFRIFPGTTRFAKAYAAVLTSLAFVDVVENHPKIIKAGVTLSDVFNAAFHDAAPEIEAKLNEFYDKRKAKFNRTNIYPKVKLTY